MKFTNKSSKTLITTISILTVAVLILTGTFAWNTIQTAITAGRGINFHYIVQLMNENYEGTYQYNNWKKGDNLLKPIYATSSYLNPKVQTNYDSIISADAAALFSNTWVRIKVTERFEHNGSITIKQAMKLDANKQLVSSFTEDDGGYFSFINNEADLEIIDIAEWEGERGRFWILDTTSTEGWLYWAEPLLATTVAAAEGDDKHQQTTTNIIDEVALTKQPSGSWDYQITATLEAMDVQLQDYNPGTAGTPWTDIDEDHIIYEYLLSDSYVAEYDRDGNLMITENSFPDPEFRKYLETDTRTTDDTWLPSYIVDGKISKAKLLLVDKINVNGKPISNLKGLEHFPNLTHLYAFNMQNLTSLDVSNNDKLTRLDVYGNASLSSLDVSGATALTELYAHNNPLLSELDVSNNDKLTILQAYSNPLLSELDVSNNDKLTRLYAHNNLLLSELDVSNNEELTLLSAHTNPLLSSLDVSGATALTTLYAFSNPSLSELDVSNNDKLTLLDAHTNTSLSELDVSNNEELTLLNAYNNPLLTSLDISMLENLTSLSVRDSNLISLTLGNHPELKTEFAIDGNRLSTLDISGLPEVNQSTEERTTAGNVFTLNPQYQVEGEKIVGNRRQNATYNEGILTWE